ncbi:jg11445 [Pararge aegeria aegeria]|uniref:Jg11445 protein n=1 Tax=Pararge aegeria aegeria TaxID=348720 RepID=A0A8S4RYN8_9NEOP|nr:jg11445 [Pararge aegeria aegeria]
MDVGVPRCRSVRLAVLVDPQARGQTTSASHPARSRWTQDLHWLVDAMMGDEVIFKFKAQLHDWLVDKCYGSVK